MPQLILISGLAADAEMWQDQLAALPARWRTQVTDVPARHASIEAMAQALLQEHSGPLVLCGASMGGMVAMEAVRQSPERIHGLALLGTGAQPENPLQRRQRENAIALFEQGRLAEFVRASASFAFARERAADKHLTRRYKALVLRATTEQWIRQNRAVMARPDARLHLAQVRCPTLVLCGESDLLTPPAYAREIAALVPGAELQLLPECGHMLTMEQPEAVNAALLAWLLRLGR
ncbi:alpha/beta fold hydrolase [Rhodoferax sp.]|uniref:alpha/beta fold hydrolase n=1 Tax=Rhodoferax sp. TaxID=50421 RepID=UPI00374C9856